MSPLGIDNNGGQYAKLFGVRRDIADGLLEINGWEAIPHESVVSINCLQLHEGARKLIASRLAAEAPVESILRRQKKEADPQHFRLLCEQLHLEMTWVRS